MTLLALDIVPAREEGVVGSAESLVGKVGFLLRKYQVVNHLTFAFQNGRF